MYSLRGVSLLCGYDTGGKNDQREMRPPPQCRGPSEFLRCVGYIGFSMVLLRPYAQVIFLTPNLIVSPQNLKINRLITTPW